MKETFVNLDFKQLPAFTPEMLKNLQNSADEKIHNFLDTHVDKDAIKDFADSALDSFN
jgi:peptide subunit release factor RF-3